jgi:hypothetical protein
MANAARGLSRNQDHRRALQSLISGNCHEQAPQLADWMKQHPAERLAAWRCIIGKRDGKEA